MTNRYYGQILLDDGQERLLSDLVESNLGVAKEKRGSFAIILDYRQDLAKFIPLNGGCTVKGSEVDAHILITRKFMQMVYTRGTDTYAVTPEGYAYYREMHATEKPLENLEVTVRTHLSSSDFNRRFSGAFAKWEKAEKLLWSADVDEHLTAIGHHCREAIQIFASLLRAQFGMTAEFPIQKTVAAIRELLAQHKEKGETSHLVLDALLNYWGCVSDLIQRQEHGGSKEGQSITWEDARLVVFQSCIIMYEIDRRLHN